MIYDSEKKEVRFDKYCQSCKYWDEGSEYCVTCDQCLEESMRDGTEVPIRYEKA